MEKKIIMCLLHCLSIVMCCLCGNLVTVHAIETPKYTVIRSESDFQIRLYSESTWMSALVLPPTSFDNSTKTGFHRLYEYIHGGNLNSSKLAFTAPVLTSMPSSGDDYVVRMYVSARFQGKPPLPNQELKLQVEKWKAQCIAVRTFSGFAADDNIYKEIEALINSVNRRREDGRSSGTIQDKGSYTIAQYNGSSHNTGRLNEVWINVSGLTSEGCPPSQ
ncbi:hypothetical protein HN51_037558 [Arachis hypogaea]|uniref:Heme-binding protein n=1 Tax=Arachis hypogaea TaxID=3818 RepID=A0A444ZVB0_ARAHY|nr:heme-binding protein 2 [Arachis ipaensis]QHO03120.1 Heme-binding protein [Arachis hypogaea]RYR18175.1 hypothetical protein Ahy_B03g062803 [Arachis hypogaea]